MLKLTVDWPSGKTQVFTDVPLDHRLRLDGGRRARARSRSRRRRRWPWTPTPPPPASPPSATWLYEPFPAPDFSLPDLRRRDALARGAARPARSCCWPGRRARRAALRRAPGAGRGKPRARRRGRRRARAGLRRARGPAAGPRRGVGRELAARGRSRRDAVAPELRHPQPPPVHEPPGPAAADRLPARRGGPRGEGLPRAPGRRPRSCATPRGSRWPRPSGSRAPLPFAGTFYSPAGQRNYLPYGHELLDQGLETAAVVAFERAAQANPSASTLYRLGTLLVKSGQPDEGEGRARARAREAAGPGRGQQRPRRAAGAGRRSARRHRALPGGAARGARLSRRAQQPRLRAAAHGQRRRGARALREGARAAARLPRSPEQPGPDPRSRAASSTARSPLPSGAREAARLRRGREQPRARTRRARRVRRPRFVCSKRFLVTDPKFESTLRHARQDPPRRPAGKPKPCPCSSGCSSATRPTPSLARSSTRFVRHPATPSWRQ